VSVTQADFPNLATILPLAGRVWEVELSGEFEYDELTVDVHLSSGSQKIGPFQFGWNLEFIDRDEVPFPAETVKKLEGVIYDLMVKHWPMDF